MAGDAWEAGLKAVGLAHAWVVVLRKRRSQDCHCNNSKVRLKVRRSERKMPMLSRPWKGEGNNKARADFGALMDYPQN
jgi:hypothetical protein